MRVTICSLVVYGSSGPTTGMLLCLALRLLHDLGEAPHGDDGELVGVERGEERRVELVRPHVHLPVLRADDGDLPADVVAEDEGPAGRVGDGLDQLLDVHLVEVDGEARLAPDVRAVRRRGRGGSLTRGRHRGVRLPPRRLHRTLDGWSRRRLPAPAPAGGGAGGPRSQGRLPRAPHRPGRRDRGRLLGSAGLGEQGQCEAGQESGHGQRTLYVLRSVEPLRSTSMSIRLASFSLV